VIAGRNRPKIDRILSAVSNACHVLADKPWIIDYNDFPKLQEVFRQVDIRELLVADMMTERHEITTRLQRDLIHDQEIMGDLEDGTPDNPMLTVSSTHHLMKQVAGMPLRRPTWWYDRNEAGSSLADISTHLVDLSLWMLFPDQNFNHETDVRMHSAREWPVVLSKAQFEASTGKAEFPPELHGQIADGSLHYAGCGEMRYAVRNRHVHLKVDWKFQGEPGALDQHTASVLGTRAKVEIRTNHQPELYISAIRPKNHSGLFEAVSARVNQWQARYSGLTAEDRGHEIHINIPKKYRTDHEDHFAEVLDEFMRNTRNTRRAVLAEMQTILTKYYITTTAAKMAQRK
jgi:predicted dehydrogenase